MAKLIFTDEKFVGQSHLLAQGETTVGRGGQNALVIPDSSVSVEHCLILTNGTEVLVRERGSANGTFVEEVRVQGQQPVKSGQRIRFGAINTRLELQPDDEGTVNDEITAIRAHGRAIQQAQHPTPPPAAHVQLHTDAPSALDDATVTLPAPPAASTKPKQEPFSPQARSTSDSSSASKFWIIAGGAMIVVVVVVCLVWKVVR